MILKKLKDFDLDKISRSGQCFRMHRIEGEEGRYSLIAYGEYLEMEAAGDSFAFSCTEAEWDRLWINYFDCGTDYAKIHSSVDKNDQYMQTAVQFGRGIRILRQELFEVIIGFIISQRNNIPRITKCVETLCRRFGEERRNFKEEKYYTFPSPEKLAGLSLEELRDCGLGYRDKYILQSSRMIACGEINVGELYSMEYEEAKKELLKLTGVGVKVAECICLFALHHADAFPIDTHIEAVLFAYYPDGFPFERYQGYAGILQQYAFYYDIYGLRKLQKNT